ncbi:hypothetical protein H2200_004555 [Cladophialophora chaetospira]|uniref:Uncharacterized protein n=1 Tax=Cladophialophora chaetospira TaxID=386627 RepID=A0AA39CKL7_9EURO|nr:hypothetical protein H2200_004555 [Cladophialophora chaetospira]
MKPAKFMFINKDAKSDSLSHSHKNERVQIHSHVQKGRRYKKSDNGIIYAPQLPFLQPGRRSRDTNDREDQVPDEDVQTQQPTTFLLRRTSSPVPAASHQYLEQLDPNLDPLLWDYSQVPVTPSLSPQSVPTFPASAEESFDPFGVTCVKVDESIYSLLQYFLARFHPNIWHLERAIRTDHAYAFRYDAMSVIQGCLHDEYNMYALLAHMSSYMQGIDGARATGDWDFYMHKALQSSQNYVKSGKPITGRMILNTFSLACAEWYRFNLENGYIHFKAAKSMIDTIGGLQAVDAPLAELLLTGDAYVAGELRTKPLWSDSEFDNGDDHPMTAFALQELQKLLSGTVQIGSGLLTSAHQGIIPADLRWVTLDLAVALSVLRSSRSNEPASAAQSSEGLHWVHIRSIAIRHRLLHMDLSDPRSDAVRIALVLWMFLCFTVTGRKRSVMVIAPFLQETLLTIAEEEWHHHEEVHLWILTIGALCATVGTAEHNWFMEQINASSKTSTGDSAKIFGTLAALSEKFFYHELAQKYKLRALADDLHDMRTIQKRSRSKANSTPKPQRS